MEVDKYINEWKSKKREKLIFGLVRWLYCEVCVQCTIKCTYELGVKLLLDTTATCQNKSEGCKEVHLFICWREKRRS